MRTFLLTIVWLTLFRVAFIMRKWYLVVLFIVSAAVAFMWCLWSHKERYWKHGG